MAERSNSDAPDASAFRDVCVVGAGAIGGWIGAGLARAGCRLSLLARGATLAALRSSGLQLSSGSDTASPTCLRDLRASAHATELGAQDLVVLAVKAPALPALVPQLGPLLRPDTPVLTLMNGVPWWFLHGLHGPLQDHTLESVDPGGVIGAALLLSTPAEGFEKIVPALIGFASLTILVPRRPPPEGHIAGSATPRTRLVEALGMAVICIYGGYFGAAAGVLLLAMLLHTTHDTLPRANALKNTVLGCANGIAALIFIFLAPVDWAAVVPMSIGCLIGAWLGPKVVRWAPVTLLRYLIGAAGLGLAVHLAIQAYG